jgi:hypothetical protein
MIFEVNRKEFIRAIKPAVEVATKNTLKEFKYENLLTIKAMQDKLVLFAYGGNASVIAPISDGKFKIDYNCLEEGTATVYADDLLTFASSVYYEEIKITLENNEVKISPTKEVKGKKKASVRAMAVDSNIVRPPNIGKKFTKEIEVDREIFVKGINSVIFAPAYEEKMYSYMCMLFEIINGKEQELRFSAGTGGRFAIKSCKGKNLIKRGDDTKIIFPKVNLSTIAKLLSEATEPNVTIKCVEVDSPNNIPEQIMIEFDGIIMCLFGIESFTKYPDLAKIISYKYPNRIYSNLEDWESVVRTIEGTRHRYNENIHNTEVMLDEEEAVFKITPKTAHTSPTFIDLAGDEDCVATGDKVWFCCNSKYIEEMISQGNKKGKVQFNFESQAILDDIPEGKPKQMRPVLIKYPEDNNEAREIVDNFYMFFTISTK